MTDITELVQSLKAAAEKATPGEWRRASTQFNGITATPFMLGRKEVMIAAASEKRDAEFIAMAHPANIRALVEALEKSEKTSEARREAIDRTHNMFVRERDRANAAEEALEKAQQRITQMESRGVTVKLPTELYTIGELIRTQDNRITDQPMFVVFQKREIIGSDEHSPSRICWVWDGEEVSELRAKRLEALYQDGRDTRGYDRYAMQEVDEFVTACFTEHGCKDYLRQNGHNLRLPYIYACGSFRNNEYQLVRNWLAGIKVEAE